VKDVLDPACPDPWKLIDEYRPFLEEISFGKVETETDLNSDFFEMAEVEPSQDELDHTNFEDIIE
jgi:hypothetical protein